MVYVDTKSNDPTIFVPLHGRDYVGVGLALLLKNTVDGTVLDMPIASSNQAGFLVCLHLSLPASLYTGEWRYTLSGVGGEIATGLLCAFDGGRAGSVQYHSENRTIQYGG